LPLAAALAPDFTVLLVDLRYFGSSEGAATTLGLRERADLSRAVDLLAARGAAPVGVFGLSLGGAVALGAAADDARIRAVAAYAPFADLRQLAHDLYAWMGPLRHAFVGALLVWGRLAFGADLTRPAPVEAAARLQIPVWLVHSREDDQIPFRHAERLREALAGNPRAEFEFMERGWHGELPPFFAARLVDFFRRSLEEETRS
ncbi:MAG TPA: alpha/beta fold hydrolase, partial [Candidatus Tectomicrobia bacterium]|nr:alpha/beta fold hydrolase [Candidatus Tectomicrobia bacterium]